MDELEVPRSDENLEPHDEDTDGQRELEDATHEPREHIAQSDDYQQAEDIQSNLESLTESGIEMDPDDTNLSPHQPDIALSPDDVKDEAVTGKPEEPLREANFQKPIEHKELGNKGTDLGNLEDLDGFIPGRDGKIIGGPGGPGGPGEQDPGSGPLDDVLGSKGIPGGKGTGFDGGPKDLKNDPEGQSGEGEKHPATGGPFGPGKGPDGGKEVSKGEKGGKKGGGGSKKSPGEQGRDAAKKILKDVGIKPKPPQKDDKEDPPKPKGKGGSTKSTPDEVGGGGRRTPSSPGEMNPKYDQDQISLHTADGPGDDPTHGGVHPDHQEKVEAAIKKSQETAGKKKKAGSEVVTDPPEHDPNPKGKSESAGGTQ